MVNKIFSHNLINCFLHSMSSKDDRRFYSDRQSHEFQQFLTEMGISIRRDASQSDHRLDENSSSHDRTAELIAIIDEILEETSSNNWINFGLCYEQNAGFPPIRELDHVPTMTSRGCI
jgi:hypothetical protein